MSELKEPQLPDGRNDPLDDEFSDLVKEIEEGAGLSFEQIIQRDQEIVDKDRGDNELILRIRNALGVLSDLKSNDIVSDDVTMPELESKVILRNEYLRDLLSVIVRDISENKTGLDSSSTVEELEKYLNKCLVDLKNDSITDKDDRSPSDELSILAMAAIEMLQKNERINNDTKLEELLTIAGEYFSQDPLRKYKLKVIRSLKLMISQYGSRTPFATNLPKMIKTSLTKDKNVRKDSLY